MKRRSVTSQAIRAIDIGAEVKRQGLTLTQLAIDNGLPECACRVALKRPYYYAEQAIARLLRRPAHKLWPERYTADGEPLHPPRKPTPVADDSTSQKRACA